MEIESVADIKLAGRAINEDWPVFQDDKVEIISQLMKLAKDTTEPELQIAACRTLMMADALNQKRHALREKKLALEHKRKLELIELAHKLGIVGDVGGTVGTVDSQPSRIDSK